MSGLFDTDHMTSLQRQARTEFAAIIKAVCDALIWTWHNPTWTRKIKSPTIDTIIDPLV